MHVRVCMCPLSLHIFYSFDFSNALHTPLRSSEDILVKLLGLRRSDLRAGQLGVDIVRDGPYRGRQSAAAAHVAGRQLGQRELEIRLIEKKIKNFEAALKVNLA